LEYYVFNIWDIDKQCNLPYDDVLFMTFLFGLKNVTLLYRGCCFEEEFGSIQKLLNFADKQEYGKGIPGEGIVVKSDFKPDDFSQPRISFKVISNLYLLKHNE